MKNKFLQIAAIILLIFSVLPISKSCSDRNDTVGCFPETVVDVVLNLNLPAYQNLQNVGGWVYINEQSSGTRGLIVVCASTDSFGNKGFKIYDRNAPHLCPDNDTTLEVVNDIKIRCPKDGAEWILLTGEPTNISQVPPKNYFYSYDNSANYLTIYN